MVCFPLIQVVISSVTTKYALSANCRREVSLADALQKPIIPLLMEDGMSWPPEGPMGMTFTQLLYIDFSKHSNQENIDDKKFEELVQKIAEYASPQPTEQSPTLSATENKATPSDQKPESEIKQIPSPVQQQQPPTTEPKIAPAEDNSKKSPKKSPIKSPKKSPKKQKSPKKERSDSKKRSKSCVIL